VEITEPAELEAHREPEIPPGPSHAFRLDLEEAVLTSVEDGERLLIQLWRPGGGVREIRRT
jgi:hypothetical protein